MGGKFRGFRSLEGLGVGYWLLVAGCWFEVNNSNVLLF